LGKIGNIAHEVPHRLLAHGLQSHSFHLTAVQASLAPLA
jgi:hypothetical protein